MKHNTIKRLSITLIIVLTIFLLLSNFTLFEDGSWIIETFQIRWITGCLHYAICNL